MPKMDASRDEMEGTRTMPETVKKLIRVIHPRRYSYRRCLYILSTRNMNMYEFVRD
jgi:hypothetical protein